MESANKASIQTTLDDPSEAVQRAFTAEGRNTLHLSSIALAAQDTKLWPELRAARIIDLLIEVFVDGWEQSASEPLDAPYWVIPLTGLINSLVSLKKLQAEAGSGLSEEDSRVFATLRQAYPRIEAVLWRDQELLTTDSTLSVVSLGLHHLYRIPDMKT
ncbi:hypothetical protein BS47DRAFT_280600 [Hydnum rufescens UP504]|uniref:Uncharacterized protein n=1 Tax=Hydnum rufescens UP504 TaxID=1448309 RepID=A0A9P6AKU0_9AGAM|nr:hypothetical protein BS47DRAFT_280600 [Hydnum rufescens UP504]